MLLRKHKTNISVIKFLWPRPVTFPFQVLVSSTQERKEIDICKVEVSFNTELMGYFF
jgi:hypothetical protein